MSVQYEYLSPGTYIREVDLSARLQAATSTSGAAVYESKRGPLATTFYSSGRNFLALNGNPDPSISFAHDCIPAFLLESSNFWGKRVVNGALYAGTTYFIDRYSANAPAAVGGAFPGRVLHNDLPLGRVNDYTYGSSSFYVVALGALLTAGNVFKIAITDGETLQNVSVAFDTDHVTTVGKIAQAIEVAMSAYADGGSVQFYNELTGGLSDVLLMIRTPATASLFFNPPTVTGGSPVAVHLDSEALLIDFIAENPGDWANDVGVQITNVDIGRRQRYTLTFSGPMSAGAKFSAFVNGTATPEVDFDTNSDTTMANIAAMFAALPSVSSAVVEVVAGATDNDRVITLVAAVAGPAYLKVAGCIVSGGANTPFVLSRETLAGVAASGEFDVFVYEQPTLSIPVERFTVTLFKQTNAAGEQTLIDQQINVISSRSNYIRVIVPDANRTYQFLPTAYNSTNVIDTTINFLAGGDNGLAALSTQIADGWSAFRNREKIPVTLLINCGYTDPYVQQTMVATAEYRYDAFAILDMPSASQQPQDAYTYRTTIMNIDSSYGAVYTPDLQIEDDTTSELRFVPPSGHVAAAYAYSDKNAAVWFAPAGVNRGRLKLVQDLRIDYELGDRELLNPIGVNCIINKVGFGPTIWGEETLQYQKSVLSAVHARRLMNKIEVGYADGLDYTVLFDPNNSYTQFRAQQLGEKILAPIKNAEGIYDYALVTDGRINTDDVIDDEEMRVDVYVDITRTAKRIILTGILTSKGAKFAELISARGATF